MSKQTDSKNSLPFLQGIWQLIVFVSGVVAGVYAAIKAVQDDFGLFATIALITCLVLLWLVCFYYALFWNPAKEDKETEPLTRIILPNTKATTREHDQAKRERHRKRVSRSAVAGLIAFPILALAGFAGWQYVQSLPTDETIVLVADFYNQDTEKDDYSVTSTIWEKLDNELEGYADVKLERLKQLIDTSDDARRLGEHQKAAIMLWGWYNTKPEETVPVSINFEVLSPPEYLPEIGQDARGNIQAVKLAELKSFDLQFRLRDEISYLTLFVLGMVDYEEGNLESAIERFSRALVHAQDPVSAVDQHHIHFFRGKAYQSQGKYEQAIADYTKAIELDPEYTYAYISRGIAYADQEDYDQAIADYNQSIELDPKLAFAYNNRGAIYHEQGNYEEAIAEYSKAIELDPRFAVTYSNRANLYYIQGDYDQAIIDLNKAIEFDPSFTNAYLGKGIVYTAQEKYEEAIAYLNRAIEFDPEYTYVYLNRGNAYNALGNRRGAIRDFQKVIDLTKNSASQDKLELRDEAEEKLRNLGVR
jgi:tetratricopeptide (TPR) repeat protein